MQRAVRAKYSYFPWFIKTGLFFVCISAGLSLPAHFVQARAYSYFISNSEKSASLSLPLEGQNSQTIALLESTGNFDSNLAVGGGEITMDDSALFSDVGPSGTIADIDSNNNHQGKVSLYVVHQGDTISQIAKMFGVSVNTIVWANELTRGASLREGQHLVILPIDGVQHTVKKGETLRGIARKYGGDVGEILSFNDLTADQKILIGDVIIIPNGKEVAVTTSSGSSKVSASRSRAISAYPSYDGYYTHPVPQGRKTQSIHGYNGVDYGAPTGTPVYAAAEGIVIVSKYRPGYCGSSCGGGYGNYIVIEHSNGTQTLYGHLSEVNAPVGSRAEKGQLIGAVGNTGRSTGPHLHFEVRGAKNPF